MIIPLPSQDTWLMCSKGYETLPKLRLRHLAVGLHHLKLD